MLWWGAMLLGWLCLHTVLWAGNVPEAGGPVAGANPATLQDQGPQPTYQEYTDLIAGNRRLDATVAANYVNPGGWADYVTDIEDTWQRFERKNLQPMRAWAQREVGAGETVSGTVLYPFSGPDVVNMLAFFPRAQTYLMIALEPVGTLPVLRPGANEPFYLNLEQSLNELLNFNFFFTKRMEVSLVSRELDGVLPVLLFFLGREQVQVREVNTWLMAPDGTITAKPAVGGEKMSEAGIPGVKIVFQRREGEPEQTLYYFQFNLQNSYWRRHPEFVQFLRGFAPFQTFVKAASYLMFKPRFGDIRQFIVDQSRLVLQTDEGIPLKYLPAEKWERRLYGKYSCPIKLFANCFQPDLAQIYQNGQAVQPLPFGIGYHHRRHASNLLLARQKAPAAGEATN